MAQAISYGVVSFREQLAGLWQAICTGTEAYMQRRSRQDQIVALQNKSDEELAAMGIKRENIALHVFCDLFYL